MKGGMQMDTGTRWLVGTDLAKPHRSLTPSWLSPRDVSPPPSAPPSMPAPLAASLRPEAEVSIAIPASLPSLRADAAPPRLSLLPAYRDLREENAALRQRLADAEAELTRVRRDVLEASEGELVQLACAVGERIAGRELRSDPTLILGWVREALVELASKEDIVVAVPPGVAELLPPDLLDGVARALRLETDPSLAAGGCEVRSGAMRLEESLQTRGDAVRRALRPGAE